MPGQYRSNQHAQQFVIVNWERCVDCTRYQAREGVLMALRVRIPQHFLKRDRNTLQFVPTDHITDNVQKEVADCTSHLQ